MDGRMNDPEDQSARSDHLNEGEPLASQPAATTPPVAQPQDMTVPMDASQGYAPPAPRSATQPVAPAHSRPLDAPQYPRAEAYSGPSSRQYGAPYGYAPPPQQHPAPHWQLRGFLHSATGRIVTIGSAALIALALVSGIGLAVVHALNPGPQGYLYTSTSEVAFIQWTEDSGHHLNGTMQDVLASPDDSVNSTTEAFTGVHDGSNISITFSGLGPTLSGTLDGNTLTLTVPDQNGLLATDVFHLASVQEYNRAVTALRQRIQAALVATQSAQATEAAQQAQAQATADTQSALDQAVESANSQLANDLSALSSDVQSLKSATSFSDALNAYAGDWSQMQNDYQQELTDYQQGCGPDGSGASIVAGDASVVSGDLSVIGGDHSVLSGAHDVMSAPLASVQGDITSVQADWQNLQAAVAADTTGNALAQFTQSDIDAAVSAAQKQLDASNKAWSQAQSKGSQYDQEAAQLNTKAQDLANSMKC
jgi:hypothetical protein